ncbi:uncharacterized protein LOC135330905 isoform X1 [Halichondria panicea]|uniref:uncharacterized protein LOC135330905 isoform X1 n=1 Tax=Halichondria panicea TaxID=6063 RepID=UPI00312BBD88
MILHWIPGLILMVTALVQGQPQYEVQVGLPVTFTYREGLSDRNVSYENTLANGSCCSRSEGNTSCSTACENRILLCFREAQHLVNDTNIAVCPLGDMTFTPSVMDTGIITFNSTISATTTTYPGSFQLYYRIIALSRGSQEVESERRTLTQPIQDRTSTLNGSSQIGIGGVRTQLFINGGLRVVCREGYFGPDCGCSPQNDSTGHFTCHINGTKVCLPGYQNPETNCMEVVQITSELTTESVQPTPHTIQQSTTTFITEAMTTIGITNTLPTIMTTTTIDEPTATIPPNIMQTSSTNEPANAISSLQPSSTSATTNAGTTTDVLPIAIGGAVGGLVVVVIIILITILLVLKTKRKKKSEEDATTIMNLEELPNSKNNTDGIDALNLYASVNKDANKCAETPQEEAPAVIPYQGQIYSEVEKTGLFGKQESDSTSEEPQYSMATAGTSKLESVDDNEEPRYSTTQFLAIDKEPQYSSPNAASASTQALNEEPRYDITFRGASTATGTNEEPHYSTAIRNVPSNTATQMQINEAGYSILKGDPKRFENVNIGPEYSKLEGTTQVTQHQVQDESQYSELETTKKPDVQIYVAGYSALEESRYSEIESETKQPQIVYADLEIADSQSADKATTQTSDNMNTTEVQYSHIKNGQSV